MVLQEAGGEGRKAGAISKMSRVLRLALVHAIGRRCSVSGTRGIGAL